MKNNTLVGNLAWKFAERISAQLVSTIVSIILARLLEPAHYGVVSIVMIFITLANVFVSDGFGSALIQKKNASQLDFFSVLYFNIFFSCVLYGILFISAPFISAFYGDGYEILTPVLRVLGLRIILTAINSVQQAYISKKMMFRKFFISTLLGTIVSAVVGISMAYAGYGVWALVAQYLVSTTVSTFALFVTLKKLPRLMFSFSSLKELFPYGAGILGTGLLITGYQEIRALIVGKMYSSVDLACYDRGKNFPNLIVTNINSSIGAVLFPKMANEQDDAEKVKNTVKNSIRFSSYIMCPMMLGLAAVATPFIRLLLTDKWIECVPLLQLFCIVYLFQPIHTANMQAIKAIGRSDVYLKLEVFKKLIELIVLLVVMWISVEAIVIGMAATTILFTLVNAYPNIKLLNYSFKEQMSDILPNVIMSLIMFVLVYLINFIPMNTVLLLIVQVIAGATIYTLLSVITKNKEFAYIKNRFIEIFDNFKKRKA
ncbi:MAG: lipopolysaccharide biosynthesis protein [Clostridia bacterium]|nr:lipopolysaccharide biosynthesis protein [Clostridia bacterium]